MKSFATRTIIRAPVERIWSILTDAAAYPSWSSTVERVVGKIAPGGKVTVYAKSAPGRAFPLQVAEFDANQRMVWTGGMPLGLFTGRRTYTLTTKSPGEVEFAMREEFSGLMAPLITRSIPDLQPSFDQFAADLKARAENSA
ncbi:MAG: SRPBCC domain-containing protein [Hyphomicrobiaceae bacterium]|nr:SRPBCC domain-containing protein [Hyphomicrobiaceae bacterium]